MLDEELLPVFVLQSYNAGGAWPGPIHNLNHPTLALTWVYSSGDGIVTYMTHSDAGLYDSQGVDYVAVALENLDRITPQLATQQQTAVDGRPVYLVMAHPDGLGSSRLLLQSRIAYMFPEGYRLALPEKSVGLAISSQASPEHMAEFKRIIRDCYESGGAPMCTDIFESDALKGA